MRRGLSNPTTLYDNGERNKGPMMLSGYIY
jgi:hypothetical protein